jgi:hypothetical protein
MFFYIPTGLNRDTTTFPLTLIPLFAEEWILD